MNVTSNFNLVNESIESSHGKEQRRHSISTVGFSKTQFGFKVWTQVLTKQCLIGPNGLNQRNIGYRGKSLSWMRSSLDSGSLGGML